MTAYNIYDHYKIEYFYLTIMQLQKMQLPIRAIVLINKFSKPLTRPDWKTKPKFTFKQFFCELKKQNKYLLMNFYYKIVRGICHHYLTNIYNKMITTGFSKQYALNIIKMKYGLEPKITMLMCNIN